MIVKSLESHFMKKTFAFILSIMLTIPVITVNAVQNWVQSATISPDDGRIILNMDREISAIYDVSLDEYSGEGTQLFMVMVVDVRFFFFLSR